MNIELDITRVEAYVTAHRARVATYVAVALSALLFTAWLVVAYAVLNIESPTLDACVLALSAAGSAIAALAFYWGAE